MYLLYDEHRTGCSFPGKDFPDFWGKSISTSTIEYSIVLVLMFWKAPIHGVFAHAWCDCACAGGKTLKCELALVPRLSEQLPGFRFTEFCEVV